MGPLARIAAQAGYRVSGSDKQDSDYIGYLRKDGINDVHIGQSKQQIADLHERSPIDWLVYSSAVPIEQPNHPELVFAQEQGIRTSKRDELLNKIIADSGQKLIAVAGTHGKTTTTAMVIWLFKQLKLPISYSLGAKISFGNMGHFDPKSEYFVYECDEFDRNFLAFKPYLSAVSGIAYDHQDIYPTEKDYRQAFREFLDQSKWKILWQEDLDKLSMPRNNRFSVLSFTDLEIDKITLPGQVNRLDGWLAIQTIHELSQSPIEKLIELINQFPGVSRRFEKIADNLYTDYAHTPEKISGCLKNAQELCERSNLSQSSVVVYEPLTNVRQYHITDAYKHLFDGLSKLYWVPTYLTREDPAQHVLTPAELIQNMSETNIAEPAELGAPLKQAIQKHLRAGDLVVCLSGGGGGSLDEWLRANFVHSSK